MNDDHPLNAAESSPSPPKTASAPEKSGCTRAELICRMAVKAGVINEKQATRAAALHDKILDSGKHIPVETILIKENVITPATAEKLKVSAIRQQDKAFCEMAVDREHISRADADAALNLQAKIFKNSKACVTAADILQNAGKIEAEHAAAILREQGRPTDTQGAAFDRKKPKPSHEASPASGAAQKSGAARRQKRGLDIDISGEPATAALVFTEIPEQSISLDDVKTLLADHDITHGIVSDETITAFLKDPAPEKRVTAAEPIPPVPGADASIRYTFDTGIHQHMGMQSENGSIDYREKGVVPKVKAGDIIAEIIPAGPGTDGVDIFGNPLPAPSGQAIELKPAHGVKLSDDRMKAIAAVAGEPRLSFSGRLSVSGEHTVDAVNIKTGHVAYDGNIIVKTVIENGFRVTGGSVKAKEVFAATIDAAGDVSVAGGITGAIINARGNVSAKYLKNARIMAYGDVAIQKEIIDSTIFTSGACKIPGGKIISSAIIAKNAIRALEVGTDVSSPCHLKIGVDEHAESEIEAIEAMIADKEAETAELEKAIARLKKEEQNRHHDITELAQEEDRTHVKIRQKTAQRDAAAADENTDKVDALNKTIADLEEKAASASQALEVLLAKQEETAARLAEVKAETQNLAMTIEDLKTKQTNIAQWVKQLAQKAVVHISGIAHEETVFEGRHATLTLTANRSAIMVKEVKTTDPEAGTVWKMKIRHQMRT